MEEEYDVDYNDRPGGRQIWPPSATNETGSVHSVHSVHSAHSSRSLHSNHSASGSVHSVHSQGGGGGGGGGGMGADLLSLKRDREREGRCSECGAQTHELRVDPRTGARTKIPLTVENEVHRGRCLLCYPIGDPNRYGGGGGGGGGVATSQVSLHSNYSDVQSASHRSVHTHESRRITPPHDISGGGGNANVSSSSFHSVGGGGGGGGRHQYSSRSVRSDISDLTGASHGHHPSSHRRTLDLPDTIESTSLDGRDAASVASITSAAHQAAEQVAIEEALTAFESESADLCDILAAMRRFPNHVRVQEQGCEKLWIQSWDDENSSAVGRVGGIPTIVDAMRTHVTSAHLQQCGCEALQNLALNEYNREIIAEQGGIAAVVGAMGQHWDVPGVQQCACTALANVATDSADHRAAVAESGGLHAILKAVQTFPADEAVLRSAYQALRSLGCNPTAELERARQQQRAAAAQDTEMSDDR